MAYWPISIQVEASRRGRQSLGMKGRLAPEGQCTLCAASSPIDSQSRVHFIAPRMFALFAKPTKFTTALKPEASDHPRLPFCRTRVRPI